MNCILQSLCHNPLIRNYFLGTTPPESDSPNVAIELHNLVREIYSGNKKPFNPHCLLYAIWNSAGHLAGYHQQDAHEFFMATLDSISMMTNEEV